MINDELILLLPNNWTDIDYQYTKKYKGDESRTKRNLLLYYFLELSLLLKMKEDDITLVDIINDEIKNHNQLYILLNRRIKAKKEKDYELADKIRKEIQEAGIEIKDNKDKIILNIK